MQQIADWLKKLGMSEYAERFAENDIDMAVLPDLTDQHLKDLGVSLGHRLKMLRAIRNLGGASVADAAPSAPVATEPTRRDEAERRQLTVMFCDLVGSTALSAKLDPEDLRSIITAYHRCCTELVERNGGFVAKYMGDGVLAYFGYPQAHEHDAERAVRAGLSLVDAIPKLATNAGSVLQVRIGIATGLVVVGDLIGAGSAQEQVVVGETPRLRWPALCGLLCHLRFPKAKGARGRRWMGAILSGSKIKLNVAIGSFTTAPEVRSLARNYPRSTQLRDAPSPVPARSMPSSRTFRPPVRVVRFPRRLEAPTGGTSPVSLSACRMSFASFLKSSAVIARLPLRTAGVYSGTFISSPCLRHSPAALVRLAIGGMRGCVAR